MSNGFPVWGNLVRWARAVLFATMAIGVVAACAPVSTGPKVSKEAAEAEAEKQRLLVFDEQIKLYTRLANVAWPILEKNADLCEGNTLKTFEAMIVNKTFMGDEFESTLTTRGFGDTPAFFVIGQDSPLQGKGVSVGDKLIKIDDWDVPSGSKAMSKVREKIIEIGKTDESVRFTIETKDGTKEISSDMRSVCNYDFGVVNSDQVNAFANGSAVFVTSGMMRFVDTDTELATIVGHEMAHNLMGHIQKKEGNAIIGMILDILIAGAGVNTGGLFSKAGAQAYSQDFEREADYVGLYLMARAGYDTKGTANLWRRMATTHPGSTSMAAASTHPATPERFLALEATSDEIQKKIDAGEPLTFEMPEATKQPPPGANPQAPWK